MRFTRTLANVLAPLAITLYAGLGFSELELSQAKAAEDRPQVLLKTTKGEILIELFEDEAPNTVANFISLVERKYYDGLTFHRVLDGFMAQGGCPDGTGRGGPGYRIACECDLPNAAKHVRGSLSMAHAGRDTGGSQFFITFGETSHLDGRHTVFGQIVRGMDVVDRLQKIDPSRPEPGVAPDKILEARVVRKRDHVYQPKKVQRFMPAGYIKKIMTDKGFGFIAPAGGGADVFFHQSVVMDADFAQLLEGQPVSYEAEIAPGRGQRATVVRRAQDTPSATSEEAKALEPLRRHPQSRGKKPSWRGE